MPDTSQESATSGHRHTNRCYWDLYECQWVCATAEAPAARVHEDSAGISSASLPSPAAQAPLLLSP